jgi:hypothetical protein
LRIPLVLSCFIVWSQCSFSSFAQTPSEQPPLASQPVVTADVDQSNAEQAATPADSDPSADPQTRSKPGGTTSPANPPAGAAATSTTYVFPTNGEMNRYWLRNTLGPKAWAGAAFTASWNQWVADSPREWTKDGKGWGQRYGSALFDNGINTTSLVWISRWTAQDPRYRRCDCTGVWPRTRHAIQLSFMSFKRDGSLQVSAAKLIAPVTGPLISRSTYYPDRHGPEDAFTGYAYYLAGSVGWNFIREFFWRMP